MKHLMFVAAMIGAGLSPAVAAQQYHQGEAVFLNNGATGCIVQSHETDDQGRYEVLCGSQGYMIAPNAMRSNPDQTRTSRYFVCPGGGKPCYFKP